jgi:AhpD family alkylhydroperoxidase
MNRSLPRGSGEPEQLLDAVQSKLGMVPNLTRVLANAPAALEGYLNFSGALAGGTLSAKVREQIALAVAQDNHCDYCLSAHSFIRGKVGLADKEIANARQALAASDKADAVLKLALSTLVQRGQVSDDALKNARDGLSPFWAEYLTPYWENRTPETEAKVRGLLTLETTKFQYLEGFRDRSHVSPGSQEIQLALFYDYRNNPKQYDLWHESLRKARPAVLLVWGKNDPTSPRPARRPSRRRARAFENDRPWPSRECAATKRISCPALPRS